MNDTPAPVRRSRPLLLTGVALLALLAGLYAGRRILAREALTAWLHSHGVAAQARVEGLGLDSFTGALSLGDPKTPDFTVDRVRVSYRLGLRGLEVSSVTLIHPVVRAHLHGGALSLGSLDGLVADLLSRPARPDAPKPRIEIERGALLLTSDFGPAAVAADAVLSDGKLVSLDAALAPTRLSGSGFEAALGPARLSLRTAGGRATATVDAAVQSALAGGLHLERSQLNITLAIPYPDTVRRRLDGAVDIRASLSGGRLSSGRQVLSTPVLTAAIGGQVQGWIDDLSLRGRATANLHADDADLGGARARALTLTAVSDEARWSRKGGDLISGGLRLAARIGEVAAPGLQASAVSVAFEGPVLANRAGASVHLAGTAQGRGGWESLGAPTSQDSSEMAALKRAARAFRFDAAGLAFSVERGAVGARLTGPLTVRPDAGGAAVISSAGTGYRLTVKGGGLPDLDATATRVSLGAGGVSAEGRAQARMSIGPIRGGALDAAGLVAAQDGAVTFTAARCVGFQAAGVELGDNDLGRLSGRFCPAGGPLFRLRGAAWRLAGRAEAVLVEAPSLQARLVAGSGAVSLAQAAGQLAATATIVQARLEDTDPERRFEPLQLSGEAGLANEQAQAQFSLADRAGRPLGQARLDGNLRSGKGGLAFDTGTLNFAEGGLQPAGLSPLAAAVGPPVTGVAAFRGRFDWTPSGATSSGVLSVPDLAFVSPAGRVSGLRGEVTFTSLAPLIAAPGQMLKVAALESPLAPLADLSATFSLDAGAVTVSGGQASVGGGVVRIEALSIPLTAGAAARGVLQFEGVQLHDLVEATPFGDKVELDARVSGRTPFEIHAGKVKILDGELHAIQPGRLSISRAALTGVAAGGTVDAGGAGSAPVEANDTFTDFAYQAMEHLAFDRLDAAVATNADGRLGVRFHVVGQSDPPQHQEIRLSLFDLIGRKFMTRPLPLPSGTGVDLTLDTTLNLDDLLSDYADYQRLRSSPKVQP